MALTATATRLQKLTDANSNSALYGIIAQADGSYLCGVTETSFDFPYTSTGAWFRSTDNGLTWALAGYSDGMFGQTFSFPSNVKANVALAGASSATDNGISIQRSANGGSSWSTVYSAAPAATPNGRYPWIIGLQSYNLTKAVAWGELDGNSTNPPYIYALSSDAGATWTPQASPDIGDYDDIANAFGIAEDSTFYMQYTKFGGVNRTSNFARSDNGGSTWTTLGALPGGTGHPPNQAQAICCFDKSNVAIAGSVGSSPASSSPGVWYSHDAGATITRLSAGDIANFPSGSFFTYAQEVKRLTTDAALLAIDQQNGSAGSPWRISLDRGETYPIEVTPEGSSWQTYQIPTGKIVVAKNGRILAPLWQSQDYDSVELTVWAIDIHC
jgi:hypothetical protein